MSDRSNTKAMPISNLIRETSAEIEGWYRWLPLAAFVLPSRFPPRAGIPCMRPLLRRSVAVSLRRSGFKARCRLSEAPVFAELFVRRVYSVPICPSEEVSQVIDIGANVGAATLWFAHKYPNAQILAVEPEGDFVDQLIYNVKINRLQQRVSIVHAAVGDESGQVVRFDPTGGGTVGGNPEKGGRVVSLSSLLEQHQIRNVDILKIDCEGGEYQILSSASDQSLRRIQCVVGEYHPMVGEDIASLGAFLQTHGFAFEYELSTASDAPGTGIFRAVKEKRSDSLGAS